MNYVEQVPLIASYMIIIPMALYLICILIYPIIICCEAVEYNAKTCNDLLDQVRNTSTSIDLLQRKNQRNEKELRNEAYYSAFRKLIYLIKNIEAYTSNISKIHGFRKYFKARSIKEYITQLAKDYETALKDLQFALAVDNEVRKRNNEEKEFAEYDKFLRIVDTKVDNKIDKDSFAEEWIKMKIKEKDIYYFEYNEFRKIEKIGEGGFGVVNKAATSDEKQVALKCLFEKRSSEINGNIIKDFIKELNTLREVGYHENIISFLGISKDTGYIMVLEYANEKNLRDYLTKKFKSLEWINKIRMALDITCGLKCLHSKGIIHRNLHSKNILVNNGKLLIADFGLSKQLTEDTSNSTGNRTGVIAYIDPQCFNNKKYVRHKKSDIYSLGVLFWEIISGRPPFPERDQNIVELCIHIGNGHREEPIKDTPLEYQQLYQRCWDGDPEKRPDIDQVHKEISHQNNVNGDNEQKDSLDAPAFNRDKPISSNQSDQYDQYYLSDILSTK